MKKICLAMIAAVLLVNPAAVTPQPASVDPAALRRLQETIREQREQLQRQARQLQAQAELLESLQKQLDALKQAAGPSVPVAGPAVKTATPPVAAATAPPGAPAGSFPAAAAPPSPPPPAPVAGTDMKAASAGTIVSGSDRIKLSISGQINRAVNFVDDGYSAKIYHVDNAASNTRFRLAGTARVSDDLSLGSRLEVAAAPDMSTQVSQNDQSPGNFLDTRWAEVSLTSHRYGKIYLGKGDTASNSTAEVDLSRTDVVQYASIADIAGGMLFREKGADGAFTAVRVADAFSDQDGLSRQSRLRYDSPRFFGFGLSGSLVSNQRSDLALFWGGEGYGFQTAAAAALANPRLDDNGLRYDGSFSVLHTGSGLNLTVSGGRQEIHNRQDAVNFYAKVGWLANLNRFGITVFGVDYTLSRNLPANDDKGYSLGAAAVQSFDSLATELYLQYRIFSLDRKSGPAVGDINVGTVGARIKF